MANKNDLKAAGNGRTCFKTDVSQAFWCNIADDKIEGAVFEKAEIKAGLCKHNICNECSKEEKECENIAWFDQLFKGSIQIPKSKSKPLTILVTGPPGSGKTILCLEICYRLALKGEFSLFISTESETEEIINNAESLGYKQASQLISKFDKNLTEKYEKEQFDHFRSVVAVWGKEEYAKRKYNYQIVEDAIKDLDDLLNNKIPDHTLKRLLKNKFPGVPENSLSKLEPCALVFDSLNIIKPEEIQDFYQQVLNVSQGHTNMVFLILNSGEDKQHHQVWEYVCDTVIRLDYASILEYYIRTIEVVKARYQEHAWGKHQLKIYSKFEKPRHIENKDIADFKRRGHPYRDEGGIFIYPSIHYYLSLYKRTASPPKHDLMDTKLDKLNSFLSHASAETMGFPKGRCTAFIGSRGGHKSHLGYMHLLHRIGKDEGALIVSLRDDEDMTKNTMKSIIRQSFKEEKIDLDKAERDNRFEVLYYHPGYITPEEFFHRMYMSIHRMKKKGARQITVLFNSLDQLSARFPLCVKQQIFIPGIINFLSGEQITSIFIAVNEKGQPEEQYGLLPMADLILSFYRRGINVDDYCESIASYYQLSEEDKNRIEELRKGFPPCKEEIVLEVVRFSGGQRAGATGILELIEAGNERVKDGFFIEPGLHFTPYDGPFYPGGHYRNVGGAQSQP